MGVWVYFTNYFNMSINLSHYELEMKFLVFFSWIDIMWKHSIWYRQNLISKMCLGNLILKNLILQLLMNWKLHSQATNLFVPISLASLFGLWQKTIDLNLLFLRYLFLSYLKWFPLLWLGRHWLLLPQCKKLMADIGDMMSVQVIVEGSMSSSNPYFSSTWRRNFTVCVS